MERAMLLRHLAGADRHIVQGEKLLERQRALIDRMQRHGYDAQQATSLLRAFARAQIMHIADRTRIRAALRDSV